MSLEEMIARDVLTLVKLKDGMSYTDISEMLRAYDCEQVFRAIGSLSDSGSLLVTEKGFVARAEGTPPEDGIAERSEETARKSVEKPERAVGDPAEKPKVLLERAGDSHALYAATKEPPRNLGDSIDKTKPAEELEDDRPVGGKRDGIQVGTVLTSTPLASLGLEDDFVEMAHGRRLYTVFELVRSLDSLQMTVRLGVLACVVSRLVELSGEPPLKLNADQVKSLQSFALSACFYFDWFGVLCTSLSKDASLEEIERFIRNGGLARSHQRKFYLREFTKDFPPDSVSAAAKLRADLNGRRYPVNGDAFDIFMVPAMREWFESGECENDEEALQLGVELIESRIQVERACYGFLRDKYKRIYARKKVGETVGPIHVVDEPVFLTAAKRFAEEEPTARFDEESRRLYCAAAANKRAGK